MDLYWTGSQRIETGQLLSKVYEYSHHRWYLYWYVSMLPSKTSPAHHSFAPGRTPRSQVLVKHSLHIETCSTSSSKSIDHPWWKGGKAPAFQSQVAHQEPTKCFWLNWLLVTVEISQNRGILNRVEQFKTQLIMPLYQVPRRNVNTPIPRGKLTGRWYRVKKMTIIWNYFTGRIWFGWIHLHRKLRLL